MQSETVDRFTEDYNGYDKKAAKDVYTMGTDSVLDIVANASAEASPGDRDRFMREAAGLLVACEKLAFKYFRLHEEPITTGAIEPLPPAPTPSFGLRSSVGLEFSQEDTDEIRKSLRLRYPSVARWI